MAETKYQEKLWLKSYEKGVPEFVKYEEICMPDILDRTAKQFPDKPALLFQGTTRDLRAVQGDGGPLCRLSGRFRGQEGGCRGDPAAQRDPLRGRLLRDPENRGDRCDEQSPLLGSGAGAPVQRFRREGPDHAGCPGQTNDRAPTQDEDQADRLYLHRRLPARRQAHPWENAEEIPVCRGEPRRRMSTPGRNASPNTPRIRRP